MANKDKRGGLVPVHDANSRYVSGGGRHMYIASTYATALFIGDPVIKTGTSNTAKVQEWEIGVLPEINKATAAGGNYLTGVIVGFVPLRTDLTSIYSAASTEGIAIVNDDPNQLYEIQEDDGGTALAATSVGLNADLVYTHTGNTTYGTSEAEIDRSTATTTATLQLKIIQKANIADNILGDWCRWWVKLNLSTEVQNMDGI